MVRYLHTEVDRAALAELPRPRLSRRLLDWVLPLLAAGALASGWLGGHRAALPQMLWGLLIVHALCVIVFGSVVRAAPATLLAAALASPLFAFSPRNETGRLAAFVEALWRAPTLADREGLSHVASLQDWRQNRFTRVLLVAFGISVGSSLAAGLGTLWLLTRL
jgi:pheromone shutdown protein TraB